MMALETEKRSTNDGKLGRIHIVPYELIDSSHIDIDMSKEGLRTPFFNVLMEALSHTSWKRQTVTLPFRIVNVLKMSNFHINALTKRMVSKMSFLTPIAPYGRRQIERNPDKCLVEQDGPRSSEMVRSGPL